MLSALNSSVMEVFGGLSDLTKAGRRRSLTPAQTRNVSSPLSPKAVTEFHTSEADNSPAIRAGSHRAPSRPCLARS